MPAVVVACAGWTALWGGSGEARPHDARGAALATYVHGMTAELAGEVAGRAAVSDLVELLDDPSFPRPDNVVALLAYLGGPEVTPALVRLASGNARPLATDCQDRARLLVPEALARIASRGDETALLALLALTDPAAAPAAGTDAELFLQATRALGLAAHPGARERLDTLAASPLARVREAVALAGSLSAAAAVEPAPSGAGPGATPAYTQDPSAAIHESALTWSSHVDTTIPVNVPEVEELTLASNAILAYATNLQDVACCATLVPGGMLEPFGTTADGLDTLDGMADFTAIKAASASRVKLIRLISWCGTAGTNIIGCSETPGTTMVLVRLPASSSTEAGTLWAHEYGHNIGLPHVPYADGLMYPYLTGTNSTVTAPECARFHAPPASAAVTLIDRGACVKDGDHVAAQLDNCPTIGNDGQQDVDADGQGDPCDACPLDSPNDSDGDGTCTSDDNCREVSNPDQANADGDARGDVCDPCPHDAVDDGDRDGLCAELDNCPRHANAGQDDGDADGAGDACDNCPVLSNPTQSDADGDLYGDACDPCPEELFDDLDGDGDCAPLDLCPAASDPTQADGDGDGIGDVCDPCSADAGSDLDADGLCGSSDPCPLAAERSDSSVVDATRFTATALHVAGDVNGDGWDDLLVGGRDASSAGPTPTSPGRARLFLGGDAGVGSTSVWAAAPTPTGIAYGVRFAAGDFNMDGWLDVVVGGEGLPQTIGNRVDVFYGRPQGLPTVPDWTFSEPSASGSYLFGVSTGDLNGDGYDELVVSQPTRSEQGSLGLVLAYFGGPTGLAATSQWGVEGHVAGRELGAAIAVLGDVNGDGFGDLGVSVPNEYENGKIGGKVYIYPGTGQGPLLSPEWVLSANNAYLSFFGGSLAPLGDANGDGFDDFAVTSTYEAYPAGSGPYASFFQGGRGRLFVFLGGSAGPSAQPWWTRYADVEDGGSTLRVARAGDFDGDGGIDLLASDLGAMPGTIDVFPASGSPQAIPLLWRRRGPGPVAAGGDVDGDGRADVAVTTVEIVGGETSAGVRVYASRLASAPRLHPDADDDAVPDACDNCPAESNPDQVDEDHNGVGDACEACPPSRDADLDAVCDSEDNCPSTANLDQADFDGDDLGDACESGAVLVDADLSGRVDGADLARLGRAFGASSGGPRYDPACDFDRNGTLDGLDLAILAARFGADAD